MSFKQGGWIIGLTLLVAATLSVARLPAELPGWVAWLRPDWVVLLLFFWLIERPHRIGLPASWLFGLLLDVLHADPLGVNGLCLATMTWVGWSWYGRLRMNWVLQQALALFVIALAIGLARDVAGRVAMDTPLSWTVIVSAAVTALLWPLTPRLLRGMARRVE